MHIFMKQNFGGNFTSATLNNFLPCAYKIMNTWLQENISLGTSKGITDKNDKNNK